MLSAGADATGLGYRRVLDAFSQQYAEHGYAILRGAVEPAAMETLSRNFLGLVSELSGRTFTSAHTPELARFLNEHKELQSRVYDDIRKPQWLVDFARAPRVVAGVNRLLGGAPLGVMRKIPFRIDAPLETTQFAVWHQDQFYVRGNLDIVTAWIPLQDTEFIHGCLAVMPGSHRLGPLPHDVQVLGKRHFPSGIFGREIRLVELRGGDALVFHSCLLHSSGLNFSDVIRFSVQPRYSRLDQPTDPGMGGIVPI